MKTPRIKPDSLLMTDLPSDGGRVQAEARGQEVIRQLLQKQRDWKDRRSIKTEKFLEAWATYFGTSESVDWLRLHALRNTMGEQNVDWRHKINGGKAYDIVETVVPYFMAATFPNKDWFDMTPMMPVDMEDFGTYITVMKEFMRHKLLKGRFTANWEIFLRQACITGTSVLAIPWRIETKETFKNIRVKGYGNEGRVRSETVTKVIKSNPDFKVEDVIDFYLDPDANEPNEADLIRRLTLTRGEIVRLIDEGCYDLVDKEDIKDLRAWKHAARSYEEDERDRFQGISSYHQPHNGDIVEVFEFWGTLQLSDVELYDIVVTWAGDTLLRLEANPYWGGKPFIVGTYTPVMNTPYGIGALEPVLGLIHEKDSIKNQRLDGLELTINPMWGMIPDSTLDPKDVTAEPGKVLQMSDPNNLWSITSDMSFATVSLNEETVLEQETDRRTGTGSFIGSGQSRNAERVTAAEVTAIQQAGGNRLSGIHAHLEDTALMPCLQRVYEYMQQFVIEDEVIPIRFSSDVIAYAQVGVDQLAFDMMLKPTGAQHVADREYELRQRMDWINLVNSNPEMVTAVNWLEVLKDLTRRFMGEEGERFLKSADAQQQAAAPPMSPQEQQITAAIESAQEAGGTELANAVQSSIAADGGQNLSAAMAPLTPPQPVF